MIYYLLNKHDIYKLMILNNNYILSAYIQDYIY